MYMFLLRIMVHFTSPRFTSPRFTNPVQSAKYSMPSEGSTNLWNCRPRNRGTAEAAEPAEPAEPREITSLLATYIPGIRLQLISLPR